MQIKIVNNHTFSEIWVNGEKYKEIHKFLYNKYLKEISRVTSKNALQTLLLQIDVKIARALIYKLLACRGYMRLELEKKLNTYKIDAAAIKSVVQECEKLGYVNDQREAQLFVNRLKSKGWGPNVISLKLQAKAPSCLDLANISRREQCEMIRHWIEKKMKNTNLNDINTKHKLYRFFKGKGFEDGAILQELSQN